MSCKQENRELTPSERREIKRLVMEMCANYDGHYKLCLPLDCPCYMLNKWWTGSYCKYFRNAVLPLNPGLEATLTGETARIHTRICAICDDTFVPNGRQAYCSEKCATAANREKSRKRMSGRRKKGL